MILTADFFNQPTLEVARELLGTSLMRNGQAFTITEVEAYDGPEDKASHAYKGLTARTAVMFGPAGVFYVYLIYGSYWMLNVVTGAEGYPAAVLIRGTAEIMGPGRLTRELGIDGALHQKIALPESGLWFEKHGAIRGRIVQSPRIGVAYAGSIWAKKPYRFNLLG